MAPSKKSMIQQHRFLKHSILPYKKKHHRQQSPKLPEQVFPGQFTGHLEQLEFTVNSQNA